MKCSRNQRGRKIPPTSYIKKPSWPTSKKSECERGQNREKSEGNRNAIILLTRFAGWRSCKQQNWIFPVMDNLHENCLETVFCFLYTSPVCCVHQRGLGCHGRDAKERQLHVCWQLFRGSSSDDKPSRKILLLPLESNKLRHSFWPDRRLAVSILGAGCYGGTLREETVPPRGKCRHHQQQQRSRNKTTVN